MSNATEEPSEWAKPLGDALQQILAEKGQTRKWLAQRIKMDPSTISRIVNGQQPTTVDQVSRIAVALGVTRRSILARANFLEYDGDAIIDLDMLRPTARAMVLAAVRTALTVEAGE